MADAEFPSGKNVRDSQADGSSRGPEREETAGEPEKVFDASAVWTGDATGRGALRLGKDPAAIPIAGSAELGGAGGAANPEELLLGATAACFINTWAIFIKKLQIDYAKPAIRVTGTLGKDPAGGYRMTGIVIRARVPEALLAADRPKVEKSLALAEKYCIISKVARAGMPVKVEIEPV
ncbi:MAG TPA: OsmC family protein [Thermoanaerobaculia bacterium]|jgi:organic hydroperoxide reductase OsmC/OhrA|nr:OsmC family protein [Thermoanaerobaculia bacterium]